MEDEKGEGPGPERKHVVAIKIGADDWESVLAAVREILYLLESEGQGRDCVSGGPDYGYWVIDKVNPHMTHERYFDDIEKWREEQRKAKAEG